MLYTLLEHVCVYHACLAQGASSLRPALFAAFGQHGAISQPSAKGSMAGDQGTQPTDGLAYGGQPAWFLYYAFYLSDDVFRHGYSLLVLRIHV